MSRIRTLALLALAPLFVLGTAPASAAPANPGGQISQVGEQHGKLSLVFSADNLPAGQTLDPKSLTLSVNGKTIPAHATQLAQNSVPVTTKQREVVLAIDTSGSMKGAGITAARQAALAYARSLPPDVRVGIVAFSSTARVVLAPTLDHAAIAPALNKIHSGGYTSLYDGILAAASTMRSLPADSQRRLVVLSDGSDTSSKHTLAEVTKALATDKIAADVVAFRLPGKRQVLDEIAKASHGTVLPAANAAELAHAFVVAAQAFRQQVRVTATVPASLSGAHDRVEVTMNAGGQSVSAAVVVALHGAATAAESGQVSTVAAHSGSTGLWVVLGVSFLALLVLALLALLGPTLRRERQDRKARLAEVNRYRVLTTVGMAQPEEQRPEQSRLTTRTLSLVDRLVRARGHRARLVTELERAGIRMRAEEWAVLQASAIAVGAVVLALLTQSPISLLPGAVLGWLGCRIVIRLKISRRARAFEEQLPDTLQLLAGSLRSGFSLNQALVGVVRNGTEPAAGEFARVLTEVRLGTELEQAMDDVADRMRCDDLHWVVMAIRISREVGGNLAEVLQNTVATMRERAGLRRHVRALTAEGRLSAKILIGLPLLMAGYMLLFRHGYLNPLVNTAVGVGMLAAGVVLLVVGSFWVIRTVKIEV
jgi:tight adherence protein B